jgi:hypothetical protein
MTRVVNIQKEPYDVIIDRSTIWGNPYSHKEGTLAKYKVKTRGEAVAAYRAYIMDNPDLMERLSELEGKVLGCHCKPLPCHGDILVDLINNRPKINLENM